MRGVPTTEAVQSELSHFLKIINDNNKSATQSESARQLALGGFKEFLNTSFPDRFPKDKNIDLADAMKFLKENYKELSNEIDQMSEHLFSEHLFKEEFKQLLKEKRSDFSNYKFRFSDFSGLDLTGCQFSSVPVPEVKENKVVAETTQTPPNRQSQEGDFD